MKRWLVIIVTSVSCGIYANQLVDAALTSTVINGCLASRRMELHVKGWGVPERLFSEPAFTNLVSVVNRELPNCDYEYVNGLTGIVKRAAFVAALTQCGVAAYHDSVVRWLGQDQPPQDARVKVWKDVTLPIATNMEDYMAMHYDAPGISNVLMNVKRLHHAASNAVAEAAIDSVLSGATKANKLYYLHNGLVDRIRDGSSNYGPSGWVEVSPSGTPSGLQGTDPGASGGRGAPRPPIVGFLILMPHLRMF